VQLLELELFDVVLLQGLDRVVVVLDEVGELGVLAEAAVGGGELDVAQGRGAPGVLVVRVAGVAQATEVVEAAGAVAGGDVVAGAELGGEGLVVGLVGEGVAAVARDAVALVLGEEELCAAQLPR
jgi:hypothetical protein